MIADANVQNETLKCSVDGLIGMPASGWISLHKNIHQIQNINTKQKYKNISLQSEQYE